LVNHLVFQFLGNRPGCGCPGGYHCGGANHYPFANALPLELHGIIALEDYAQFVQECNSVLNETALPECPLSLLMFCLFCCAECYWRKQRENKINDLVDRFNLKVGSVTKTAWYRYHIISKSIERFHEFII
jgi:hypothetical protein